MSHDTTTSYQLPAAEVKLLKALCSILEMEQETKISRAEAVRQALDYFTEHKPKDIEILPRAFYKRGGSALKRTPFYLKPETLDQLDHWTEEYSANRSQVIRQALIIYAKSKGLAWEVKEPELELDPSWKGIRIDAETASFLAGYTLAVIHKYANEGKYRYYEEVSGGYRPKRLFDLAEIIRFFQIPAEEIQAFVKEGEDRYKARRRRESGRG